jgi:hypothetical protein
MDKPRMFLGASGKQRKLLEALARGLDPMKLRYCRPSTPKDRE